MKQKDLNSLFNGLLIPLCDRITAEKQETIGMREDEMGSGHEPGWI